MEPQELLANIAQDYYLSGLNLEQIASKYQLSRYLVNKYLKEARERGIVTFIIQSPEARNHRLEQQLQQEFPIKHLHILQNSGNPTSNHTNINRYAAHSIERYIRQSSVVGTTWGSTVYNMTDEFSREILESVTFTQFIGENMKYESEVGSMRMVERVAKQFSSKYCTLAGPLYIVDDATRKGMLEEIATRETLETATHMELLFTSLGTLDSVKSIPAWWTNIDRVFPGVSLDQIAGLAYGRPFDVHGNFLNQDHDTTFGLDLETIMKTPVRFAMINSKFKTKALLGALRGGLFTDIVMSESVALRVVAAVMKERGRI